MEYTVKHPIVLLVHRRYEKLQQVLNVLRRLDVSDLYVVGDGPARPEEKEGVKRTRDLIEGFDRAESVRTNYENENIGLELRIPDGLDWVFDQEKRAIIIEEDCVPNPSFFRFCDQLLERYQKNTQIMSITGTRYILDSDLDYSYYFSHFMDSWGWATWEQAWAKYRHELSCWNTVKQEGWLFDLFDERSDALSWQGRFDDLVSGTLKTWDYRWQFQSWMHSGLHISPKRNLVSNIGFDDQGTHTVDPQDPRANLERSQLNFPLDHPPWIKRDIRRDRVRQRHKFNRRGWLKRRVQGVLQTMQKFFDKG